MLKSPEIKVNPAVLKTLRESSGYTVEEIAKKIKTTVTKVQETEKEKGIASFTLTQIKKLADIYHRSLASFFTDTIPVMPALTDYRINSESRSVEREETGGTFNALQKGIGRNIFNINHRIASEG